MYLMVLVLNKTELLDEILENLYNVGIKGATVMDSQGMGRTVCDNVPLFGGLRSMFEDCRPGNKTIISVIRNEEMIEQAVKSIENVIGDLQLPGQGIFFTVPLHQVRGHVLSWED